MLVPDNRVIMISGANRGIGSSVAKTLAARGYRLSLGARQPDTIDIDTTGDDVMTHAWDATDPEASQRWTDATLSQFGQIDGVVMNAGIFISASLEDGLEEDMDAMWEVNFKGPLRLIRATLPALKHSGTGRVINVVSIAGKRLLAEANLGYSASKFAAIALNQAIRQYGWDSGVRGTAICPGMVDTDMVANAKIPAGQYKIPPDTIAETVAYALSLPNEATVGEILVNSRIETTF